MRSSPDPEYLDIRQCAFDFPREKWPNSSRLNPNGSNEREAHPAWTKSVSGNNAINVWAWDSGSELFHDLRAVDCTVGRSRAPDRA